MNKIILILLSLLGILLITPAILRYYKIRDCDGNLIIATREEKDEDKLTRSGFDPWKDYKEKSEDKTNSLATDLQKDYVEKDVFDDGKRIETVHRSAGELKTEKERISKIVGDEMAGHDDVVKGVKIFNDFAVAQTDSRVPLVPSPMFKYYLKFINGNWEIIHTKPGLTSWKYEKQAVNIPRQLKDYNVYTEKEK